MVVVVVMMMMMVMLVKEAFGESPHNDQIRQQSLFFSSPSVPFSTSNLLRKRSNRSTEVQR